jgi:hypothetical protein
MTTMTQARDDVFTMFLTAWNANAAFDGYVPEVRYAGTAKGPVPPAEKAWCRVTLQHTTGGQVSFGAPGGRRFERRGLMMVQLFVPTVHGRGLSDIEQLATVARNAWEGLSSPNGVWFRNIRVEDVGEDGPWWNTNVMGNFIYDEIR